MILDSETHESDFEKRPIGVLGVKAQLERLQERIEGIRTAGNKYRQLFWVLNGEEQKTGWQVKGDVA